MTYDILKDKFCLYCQRPFKTPENMQRHVEKKHPHTYAHGAILAAREKRDNDRPHQS